MLRCPWTLPFTFRKSGWRKNVAKKPGIPKDVTFQPKWALALALIDRALAWEVPGGVIIADAGYGNTTEFRTGLAERKLFFVVGVQNTTAVWVDSGNLVTPPAGVVAGRGASLWRWAAPMSVAEVSQKLASGTLAACHLARGHQRANDQSFRRRTRLAQP